MKYLVLMYANESEAPQTQEELQALQPAWFAYMQEASSRRSAAVERWSCSRRQRDDRARAEWQAVDHRWPLRRNARAIRRILRDRVQRPRRSAALGGEDSHRQIRLDSDLPLVGTGITRSGQG